MNQEATLYLPLSADVELKITVQARFFNGINSDPKTLTREPSMTEMFALRDAFRRPGGFDGRPTLDYPLA